MDSNERAKKAAETRKSASKSTTGNNTTSSSSGLRTVNLPKVGESTFDKKDVDTSIHGTVEFDASTGTTRVNLPNLPVLDVDGIASTIKLPTIKTISDVRKPDFSEDEKCDQTTYVKAVEDYKGAIRYQQLIVWANNYKGEEYKAIASAAKAYTQGLAAKGEIERAYQQFLTLAKLEQITTQKGIEYVGQAHKTATVQASLPYTLAENESTLEKQRIKARISFEEAKQANLEFTDWLASLKGKKDKAN